MVSLALVPFPSVGHAHRRSVSVMSHGPSIYHLHRRRCGQHERVLEKAHRSALPHLSFCSCEKLLSFFLQDCTILLVMLQSYCGSHLTHN